MTISASGGIVTLTYCSDSPDYNSGNTHTFHLYSSDSENGSYRLVASLVNDNLVVSGQSSHCMPGRFNGQTLNRWYKGWGGLTNADPDYDWATSRKVCMGTCVTPTPTPTNTPVTPSPTPTNTPVTPTVTDTPTPTPTNVLPTFGEASYSFSVAENAAINTSVGAVSATDQNGDEISYSILAGNTAGKFGIGTTNGNITLAGSLDYETTASYSLTARANDGKADTDVTVAINVMDVNEPPDAPATPTVTANGSTSLTVTWQPRRNTGPDITDYDVQYRIGDSGTPTDATHTGTATRTSILLALAPNTTYGARVLAKNPEGASNWSSWGSVTTQPTPLATPTNLDVRPLPERKATLSWDAVANASEYVVEIRKHGETAWSPRPSQSGTSYEIVLDNILSGKGLGDDPYAYQFRVKATSQSTQYDSSLYSEVVTIIDTPITKANGDSRNTTDGMGKATLEWTEISDPGILGIDYTGGTYSFRYRKVGNYNGFPHSHHGWRLTEFATDDTTTRNPITGLDIEAVYAIQLIYKKTSTPAPRVYAARDVYVWPSDRQPVSGERVASFPLRYSARNKAYTYRICEDTFPGFVVTSNGEKENPAWRRVVIHALEQWEVATGGLVTMTPELYYSNEANDRRGALISRECADYSRYIQDLEAEIAAEYSGGPLNSLEIDELRRNFLQQLSGFSQIQTRDQEQLNEIKMVDVEERYRYLRDVGAFPELAGDVGLGCVFRDEFRGEPIRILGCAVRSPSGATTDILLHQANLLGSRTTPPALPGGDEVADRGDVPFNRCPTSDRVYDVYETLVHEAGHVLGLGHSFSARSRDTVMPPSADAYNRSFRCSPHPFDIMAIYALYQSR